MPKVTIIQVVYNNFQWIEPVFKAVLSQTFKDYKFVAVIAGSTDGSKQLIAERFPQVTIIDPGYNIGFAKGHNLVFEKYPADFYQLVNPDMVMTPNYVEEMLKVFADKEVGAATGKLYRIRNFESGILNQDVKILDTTGVNISKSGRAGDRGQHEADIGQYDLSIQVDAVSGAGAMYRSEALQDIKLQTGETQEYFDEDFHSYWEDVDLTWRMKNRGWKNVFVPTAVGYHGRTAGSSKNGYLDVLGFIKHHRALPLRIRQLNYKNHILMYIKNSSYFYPQFFIREFFMLWYILFFEISTLKVLPELIKQIPKIWMKRKLVTK